MQSNESRPHEDLALANRMLGGDERAMAEFCDRYLARLYRFALQRLGSPEDADDVVQVVLSNAARRIETYRGESTLLAWLLAICRREVARQLASRERDVIRIHGVEPADGGADDPLDSVPGPARQEPDAVAAHLQLASMVHASLDRLPERQALVLELKYVDGRSSKEIAERLDLSDEAVQSLLARARRSFREVCDERIFQMLGTGNGAAEDPS